MFSIVFHVRTLALALARGTTSAARGSSVEQAIRSGENQNLYRKFL